MVVKGSVVKSINDHIHFLVNGGSEHTINRDVKDQKYSQLVKLRCSFFCTIQSTQYVCKEKYTTVKN
jgi:hypothetical protein